MANNTFTERRQLRMGEATDLGADIGALPHVEDLEVELENEDANLAEDAAFQSPPTENLAEGMEDRVLHALASTLVGHITEDINSLRDWREIVKDGFQQLGLSRDEADVLFDGAPTVTHPLLLEAIVKYQAKARAQILPNGGPAFAKVRGASNPEKRAQVKRIANQLNWRITEKMPEYESEHDRMLMSQAFYGSGITKTYFDRVRGTIVSRCVHLHNFIVNNNAVTFDTAERKTEVVFYTTQELQDAIDAGIFRDIEVKAYSGANDAALTDVRDKLNEAEGRSSVNLYADETHPIYECHVRMALDPEADPTPLHYIVTIHKDSGEILSIYLNEDEAGDPLNYYTHWPFIPGFGVFGYGYIHLLGGLTEAATKTLRQLLVSGTFANFPAGFKAHGLRTVGSSEPLLPGEWREVNAIGQDLQKALAPLPYKEPSPTLVKLLEFIVTAGQRFADSVEEIVNQSKNYGPVNTTLALMEASGQLFNGIHQRLFVAQKHELGIIFRLERDYGGPVYEMDFGVPPQTKQQDFAGDVDILPITDPATPSRAHVLSRAMSHHQVAMQAPEQHDMDEVLLFIHEALGEDAPERFLKKTPPPPPQMDPVTENAAIIAGQPVKAYPTQNHMAHIQLLIHGVINNPLHAKNQMVMQLAQAHLQEHLAFKFKQDVEVALGQQLPPDADPAMQEQYGMQAAAIIDRVVQRNINEAQALTQQTIEIDPAFVLREKELEIEARDDMLDHQREMAKIVQEDQHHKDEMALKTRQIALQNRKFA